jgi:hypothetical protein
MGEWFLRLAEQSPGLAKLIVVCATLVAFAICATIAADQVSMWSS